MLAATLLLPMSALSHQPTIPHDVPPAYQAECGSCHLAYLPSLLPESEWRSVMRQLGKHYGDNASLDETTRLQIEDFLARNAGSRRLMYFGAGDPPRLTATAWFQHKHKRLPTAVWSDKRVGSAPNCAACHPEAERGLFNKFDVTVPSGYWGDD